MPKWIEGIAHIAVAVKNLDEVIGDIEKILDEKAGEKEIVPTEKVRLQFVHVGGVRIEFLEPTSSDSPVSKFLEKRGNGIHHIALKVKNIEKTVKDLKDKGVTFLSEGPKEGAHGCKVIFMHPKSTLSGILFELVEE